MKKVLVAAAVAAVLAAWWILSREPTYLPPKRDEFEILAGLAGAFPAEYGVAWRQHGSLRSTDADARRDPTLLRGAQFVHNVTTASARSEGAVYVEAAYSFFNSDHEIDIREEVFGRDGQVSAAEIHADAGVYGCWCDSQVSGHTATSCYGALGYGNYEFSLLVSYNSDVCVSVATESSRRREFLDVLKTADQLIHAYLEPLRRKPRWLEF
jgi:hypothetical protein